MRQQLKTWLNAIPLWALDAIVAAGALFFAYALLSPSKVLKVIAGLVLIL